MEEKSNSNPLESINPDIELKMNYSQNIFQHPFQILIQT